MSLISWFKPRRSYPNLASTEREKKDRQTELALTVMRFDRRSSTVRELAEDALKHMKERGS